MDNKVNRVLVVNPRDRVSGAKAATSNRWDLADMTNEGRLEPVEAAVEEDAGGKQIMRAYDVILNNFRLGSFSGLVMEYTGVEMHSNEFRRYRRPFLHISSTIYKHDLSFKI